MTTIVAVIDGRASSLSVLRTAQAVAEARGADVEALQVWEGNGRGATVPSGAFDVPFVVAYGDPATAILAAARRPDVAMVVMGSGRPTGEVEPAGTVTETVMLNAAKPVVLVPAAPVPARVSESIAVLVPVDGSDGTVHAIQDATRYVGTAHAIALHVFTPATAPHYWDHYYEDCPQWCRDFLDEHCDSAPVRVEVRQGDVVSHIVEVAAEEGVGLIAMAWSQDLSPGRAAAVTGVLSRTRVPVLLFPATGAPARHAQLAAAPAA